jgi:hypothetical protein
MADDKVPYVPSYGAITKALNGIKKASTPGRFTGDFLATKLQMKGGTPKPVIPFLKKMNFLASDGTPTELYKKFRNPASAGAAAATGLRNAYSTLYEINEYAHDLSEPDLKGLIVQATGFEPDSSAVRAALGSFKALREFADFEASGGNEEEPDDDGGDTGDGGGDGVLQSLNLGYTINLHLPASTDVAVFNAIFKSLRENLLR